MWIAISKLASLEGVSASAIAQRIRRGAYERTRQLDGAWEVHLDSLTPELRDRYLDQAFRRQQDLPLPATDDALLSDIAPERLQEARWRKSFLRRWQTWDLAKQSDIPTRRERMEHFLAQQQERKVSRATLLLWERAWRSGGLLGLLPKARRSDGAGSYVLDDGMIAVIEQQYLTQARRSVRTAYKRVAEYCKARGLSAPSEMTVWRFIREKYSHAALALHREGGRRYRSFFEPIAHRDYAGLEINAIWCGDQRTMDTLLKVPHGKKYLYQRPVLTLWMDVKSACLVGWHLSFESDAYTIALALRRGFKRFGLPQMVYMDNGKNYRSLFLNGKTQTFDCGDPYALEYSEETRFFFDAARQGEREAIVYDLSPEERGLFDLLDIEVRHSIPVSTYQPGSAASGVPRAKPVEPMFNVFHALEQELPGWCGHNSQVVPDKLKREIKADKLLVLDEYRQEVERWIDEQNQQAHGWRNKPALDFYADFEPVFARERDLDLLLRPKRRVMVKHSELNMNSEGRSMGVNLFPGLWYSSEELTQYSGQYVIAWYDPMDLSQVVITTAGARPQFICEIRRTDLMSWAPTEQEYKAVKGRQKRARKAIEDVREHQHVLNTQTEDLLAEVRREQGAFVPPPEPKIEPKVIRLTDYSQVAQEVEERAAKQQAANDARGAVLPFRGAAQQPQESEREHDQQAARLILEKEQEDEDDLDNAERRSRLQRAARALQLEEEEWNQQNINYV